MCVHSTRQITCNATSDYVNKGPSGKLIQRTLMTQLLLQQTQLRFKSFVIELGSEENCEAMSLKWLQFNIFLGRLHWEILRCYSPSMNFSIGSLFFSSFNCTSESLFLWMLHSFLIFLHFFSIDWAPRCNQINCRKRFLLTTTQFTLKHHLIISFPFEQDTRQVSFFALLPWDF